MKLRTPVLFFAFRARAGLEQTSEGLDQTLRGFLQTWRGFLQTSEGLLETLEGLLEALEGLFRALEGLLRTLEGLFQTLQGFFQTLRGLERIRGPRSPISLARSCDLSLKQDSLYAGGDRALDSRRARQRHRFFAGLRLPRATGRAMSLGIAVLFFALAYGAVWLTYLPFFPR